MHRDRTRHGRPQGLVPAHISLGDRSFEDRHLRIARKRAQHGLGVPGVDQKAVEVEVQLRVWRRRGAHGLNLRDDVEPGPSLQLERGVACLYARARLRRPVLRRHVVAPPRQRTPRAHRRPQQPVHGNLERLADHVEQRLLEAGAKRVIPKEIGRIRTGCALHARVRHDTPGVVRQSLAPPHEPGIGGDLANLGQCPVGQPAPHVAPRCRRVASVHHDPLDLGDSHAHTSR